MAVEEYVDWRGNAVDGKKHGGVRATLFLYVLALLRSCPNSANFSLVAYLYRTLHLGIVSSSTVITFLVGAVLVSTALMNFISNGYIKRSTATFVFGPFVFLGYMLLALQAHLPSLHPRPCYINKEQNNCQPAHGWSLALLYLSLLLFAMGEGCMRACIPSLCADQFRSDDSNGPIFNRRSLNLHKLANSLGAIFGLAFLVWVQNNQGWNIGFLASALVVLVGLLVAACGLPFYQIKNPAGSPLTIILQVLVSALRKRHSVIHTAWPCRRLVKQFALMEKRTYTRREKMVAVLQMLPIFMSSLLIFLPFTLLMTLTIQVGRTMDKRIGTLEISSASLITIPIAFHMLLQPLSRRVMTPFLRKMTGDKHGISPLQQIGAGSVCGVVAACVAALVESKRMAVAEEHHLTQTETNVPMSVFWLLIQFFLLSAMELASFNGLVEFIKREAPPGMKLIAPAVQSVLVGLATWLACVFIQLVNRQTRYYQGGRGWLDGSNFNRNDLDRFFLLLAAFEFIALINFCFWARKYVKVNINFVPKLEDEGHN